MDVRRFLEKRTLPVSSIEDSDVSKVPRLEGNSEILTPVNTQEIKDAGNDKQARA